MSVSCVRRVFPTSGWSGSGQMAVESSGLLARPGNRAEAFVGVDTLLLCWPPFSSVGSRVSPRLPAPCVEGDGGGGCGRHLSMSSHVLGNVQGGGKDEHLQRRSRDDKQNKKCLQQC